MSLQISEGYIQTYAGTRLRETSDFTIVVRGDAWTSAPASVNNMFASKNGAAGGKEFRAIGAQVTVGSTYYTLAYDHSLANPAVCTLTPPRFLNYYTKNNFVSHFNFYFSAAPAFDIKLFVSGTDELWLTTASKLKVINTTTSSTQTSATALSAATTYQVEMRRTLSGAFDVRHDEGAVEATCTSNASTVDIANVTWGSASTKGSDPKCSVRLSEIVFWAGDDTISSSWLNSCTCVYGTVTAAGTYNDGDYVGSSSKYLNVDDYLSGNDGDTTYNEVGSTAAAEAQTHSLTDGTYADTIKGIVFFCIVKISTPSWGYSGYGLRVRDNGVNYDIIGDAFLSTTYGPTCIGYDHRPGGAALTQATINAMEMGVWASQIATGPSGVITGYSPDSDETDDDWTGVPDNVDKYKNFSYSAPNDADYIEETTNGERQSFGYTIGTEDKNIAAVNCGGRQMGVGYKFKIYVKISGTRYYSDEKTGFAVFGASYYTWNTNPAGGYWTKAAVEAAEWGYEVTAVPAAGGGDTVWVKMSPSGFWGPF